MGEPGTQLSVWALSSAASRSLAWAHQGWVVALVPAQSRDGDGLVPRELLS